jgi:hypothetical protein
MTAKNLDGMLSAMRTAQAPEKFTIKFLESLGYTSTNDRLIIGVLKGLGFVDENSVPKQRYYEYLDETQHKIVLAQAIREGYADLFRVNSKANEMDQQQVKNKLKTLTQGAKSENVLGLMAMTFTALCKQADFSKTGTVQKEERPPAPQQVQQGSPATKDEEVKGERRHALDLAYNIHIELPPTRDQAVYDAIFRSIREHLL